MRNTKYDTLLTITAIIAKYQGNWCYASRDKLLELLHHHHRITIGYRQLGNHLADLRNQGFIKTYLRNHRRADGTLCLLTSARCLTIKACKYLIKRGVSWARNHLQKLKRKYLPPKEGKPYQDKPPPPKEITPHEQEKNPFLDPDLRHKRGLTRIPPFTPAKS